MAKMIQDLKRWREAEGLRLDLGRPLTFEEAAARIVVAGEPATKSTWHAWESGKRVPARNYMPVVCELVGISSDIFYGRRPIATPITAGDLQLSLVV